MSGLENTIGRYEDHVFHKLYLLSVQFTNQLELRANIIPAGFLIFSAETVVKLLNRHGQVGF